MPSHHDIDKIIEQIALMWFFVPTLRTRHCDNLDFHEVSIWQIERALRAAYEAGVSHAKERAS
jgi:hypothetical protein